MRLMKLVTLTFVVLMTLSSCTSAEPNPRADGIEVRSVVSVNMEIPAGEPVEASLDRGAVIESISPVDGLPEGAVGSLGELSGISTEHLSVGDIVVEGMFEE